MTALDSSHHFLTDLLGDATDVVRVREALRPVGFRDWAAAHRSLRHIADSPTARALLANMLPHLLVTLADAPTPDRVMVNLERLAQSTDHKIKFLHYLADRPRAIETLATLFSGSQFLTEILLRNPEYLKLLMEHHHIAQPKSLEQFCIEAQACTITKDETDYRHQLDALRRFQRWELLRIGTCDLLDLFDLAAVTRQLSRLADSLVRASLRIAAAQSGSLPTDFVVIAMGKLGGNELNYSSDIDLLFVAAANATRYRRLAEKLIDALSRVTSEGFLYRVDMRLRPWGQVGPLVSPLSGHLKYLTQHARLWERQALLKARPIAGDPECGGAFLRQVQPLLYNADIKRIRADVHDMKLRTESALEEKGRTWGEVKLGAGSIRDIEFVVQYLQLVHGARYPKIRTGNTQQALPRLLDRGLISRSEHRILTDGYVFLRTIEHHLQMMHYRQTHTLPTDDLAMAQLARRLGFQGEQAGEQLVERYEEHRAAVRTIYLSYLGSANVNESTPSQSNAPPSDLRHHLARMEPSYQDVFDADEIRLHAALADRLSADSLAQVHAVPLRDGSWRVTIVAYDYPGELSFICGLLFVHGLSINDGQVFTYEPQQTHTQESSAGRRKIVDVFTVRPPQGEISAALWVDYATDLEHLLQFASRGQMRQGRGELAKRVASALRDIPGVTDTLYPIEIEIDNNTAEHYTVLRIDSPDTIGFLYEFTNALAMNRIYIARVIVDSTGNRVHDILYVTDANGYKITSLDRQRELRTATILIKHFTHLLPHSPNPESALLHFREFLAQLFRRPDWPAELASLEQPQVLDAMARLLGVSDFLWDDFLRMQHANLFPVVRDLDALTTAKSRQQLQAELERELRPVHDGPQPPADDAPWQTTLNAFKDREMFRIDMRHILGHTPEFGDFSAELTDLAEVVVNAAYHLCHQDLRTIYGTPSLADGQISEMTVCALGKFGGHEIGFASDIELMFVYAGNGHTTGPQVITTSEFYEKVVQQFIGTIQAKQEGIFEIDLRLRPYGKSGSMAVSIEAFSRYFASDGPAWDYERQALVKLRPVAGDDELGERIVELRDRFVYDGQPFDVTAMRAMRERQIRHLVTGGTFNAKFSPGGLVDVEYLVQALQINNGHRHPELCLTNIRQAMTALTHLGILSEEAYTQLHKAHTFLRWLIDALRMVRGNAKDLTVPPPESEAFAFLARRLRYGGETERLHQDLLYYTARVQELNAQLLS